MYPGSAVLPGMLSAYTDMALLRAKGIQSYGLAPVATAGDSANFGVHSDVERMPESSLYQFVEFTWTTVSGVSVHS